MKQTIRIHTLTSLGWREVEGEIVGFEGFEDFQFTLHHELPHQWWIVSEASTGMAIREGPTRALALQKAAAQLNAIGPVILARSIDNARADNGFAQVPFEQLPGIVKSREKA